MGVERRDKGSALLPKVGYKGVYISRTCFRDVLIQAHVQLCKSIVSRYIYK